MFHSRKSVYQSDSNITPTICEYIFSLLLLYFIFYFLHFYSLTDATFSNTTSKSLVILCGTGNLNLSSKAEARRMMYANYKLAGIYIASLRSNQCSTVCVCASQLLPSCKLFRTDILNESCVSEMHVSVYFIVVRASGCVACSAKTRNAIGQHYLSAF